MTTSFRIGDMKKRLHLQKKSDATGLSGQRLQQWVELFPLWADIEPLTAGKKLAAQALHPTATHRIYVRWRPLFADQVGLANLRLVAKSRVFSIDGALNVEEKNTICEIYCTEGINDG